MADINNMVSFLWSVADLLRGRFQPREYQDVILPMTVLRRFDAVIAPKQDEVRITNEKFKDKIEDMDPVLRKAAGTAMYNTSRFDFKRLLEDPANIDFNVQAYLNAYSPNVREIMDNFDFRNTLARMARQKITFLVFEKFQSADLHPESWDNHSMGQIFEELIRKFNEETNESPGEHYTPREIVRLMTELMLAGDEDSLATHGLIRQVYDSCCGTGGMLTIAKEHINSINPEVHVELSGQELNPKTFAIAKSDMLMVDPSGKEADNIRLGSTLSEDQFPGMTYHYLISNPPYGVEWKADKTEVMQEHKLGRSGRFAPGLPRVSDGQTLFLLNMLAKMKSVSEGGSRIAIVMNGSPLFTGDANSGESEIRRYVMENDLVESIVAVPEQMFYNTGIATYIWVVTNRKSSKRKGLVQLINASGESFWTKMRKSLGSKRRKMEQGHIDRVMQLHTAFDKDTEYSKVYPTTFFGYKKITVDRPLQLNFQASQSRQDNLAMDKNFQKLEESDQATVLAALATIGPQIFTDRSEFQKQLLQHLKNNGLKLKAPAFKSILNALSERDSTAAVCKKSNGETEHDGTLRDTERIPLDVPIKAYMEKEVLPHVPDAWVNSTVTDANTGEVGKVGYEINFNRYFYVYQPPRPLSDIEGEIRDLQDKINDLMGKLFEDDDIDNDADKDDN